MWTNFFRDGGFGMWPTVLFGFFLVATSGLYALRPEKRFLLLAAVLGAATFGSGILGAAVGIINTMRYAQSAPAEEHVRIAMIGTAESLNNVVLALILFVLASLMAAVGAARAARSPAA
jgi:hypothetical protein